MTPRKTNQRHRTQHSQSHLPQQVQPSDYESEAPFIAPPTRTNTDLNLSVLQRYNPSIHTILSIAPSAVIYNFIPADQSWDRAEIEGTLFVCETLPNQTTGREGCCMVVLNKKSLDNLLVDMAEVQNVEVTTEFLILNFVDRENAGDKIIGVYIHADKEDTREVNCRMVKDRWEALKESDGGLEDYGESDKPYVGRKLDLNQLFSQGR